MTNLVLSIFTTLFLAPGVLAQSQEFYGKLDTQLYPDMVHVYQRVYTPPKDKPALQFAPTLAKESIISGGELIDQRAPSGKTPVLLVEPPSGQPFLAVDLNSDGSIGPEERYVLNPRPDRPNDFVAVLQLPRTRSTRRSPSISSTSAASNILASSLLTD